MDSTNTQRPTPTSSTAASPPSSRLSLFLLFSLLPITASLLLYPLILSNPSQLKSPPQAFDDSVLRSSALVWSGQLSGPEDFAYDKINGWMYTGCADGWIKRVKLNEPTTVEKLVNTGGRPLGITLRHREATGEDTSPEIFIADAFKGLLKLTNNRELILLTNQAEGKEFKLTDGVDVAEDGTVYFTDATLKYGFKDLMLDVLGIESNGRLLSFEPKTGETKVLLRDLYFANGVAVSPDQNSVIFCETTVRRCSRYYVKGSKTGSVEMFIENVPGSPDNVNYDGEGRYWIGLYSSLPSWLYKLMGYELFGKGLIIMDKYIGMEKIMKNAGVLAVDLEGNPVAHFFDRRLSSITSGVKVGKHLYCGSLHYPHIVRLDLTQYPI